MTARTAVPITHDNADRMRVALQLIASLPVGIGENEKRLALAVNTAKAALADDGHDPMNEVLR